MKEDTRKNIKVQPSTYNLINAVRKDNESFNDTIERIITSGVIIRG